MPKNQTTGNRRTDTVRFTDAGVKKLAGPAPDNKRGYVVHWDEASPVGLRVTKAGARSYITRYRAGGVERSHTIGSVDAWSLAAAREKAREIHRLADDGVDVQRERTELREAPTVADLAARYVDEWLPRKRASSQVNDNLLLDNHIKPRLGSIKVRDLTYADIDGLHRKMKATPYQANRALALVSKMLSLAVRWGMRDDNPARHVERFPEHRRERFLTPDEMKRLAAAIDGSKSKRSAAALRMLVYTGARRGEVLQMRWSDVDLDGATWTRPAATTKQKRQHSIPLAPPALAVLRELRAKAEPDAEFVFESASRPGEALSDIKKTWHAVTTAAKLQGVRLHDLRHSFASVLASSGHSLQMVGSLLGHTQVSTTARYAHLYDDARRAAAERAAELIDAASTKPAAAVIPIRGAKA